MKKLAVLGASGHGKVVSDAAELCGWEVIDFFDDATEAKGLIIGHWPVVGTISDFFSISDAYAGVIVAIGDNKIRGKFYDDLFAKNKPVITLVHPGAIVSRYAQIGLGSIIVAGAVVNAYSVIGRGVIVNTNASVDHDCQLGDYVHISPGAQIAGGVNIGRNCWIGIGACIKQKVIMGDQVIVGAGAVVLKNISDNVTVVGVPARPL